MFSVAVKDGRKTILSDVTGELNPGELTCILGPSGSGKTSLLNILAGRVRKGGKSKADIGGEISLNSNSITPFDHQSLFGYVMQDDALLGTMTPREVLKFSATLRLDDEARASQGQILDDLLKSLGLSKCADTMVGNELIKGISGGERKRTAVGAELITNPQITFLDEPTSGLDTSAAYNVISVLKQLTVLRQSVLCTIHQPSSEIFQLFDKAIFLCQGRVVYLGPPSGIRAHFSGLGHKCPQDYNPADFVMFLIGTEAPESQVNSIIQGWHPSQLSSQAQSKDMPLPRKGRGFCAELSILAAREVKNVLRDKGTLGARFGSVTMLTVIFSLVFFQIGSTDPDDSAFVDRDRYDFQSHFGALTMLMISSMFGAAQPMLLTFASERPVFIRERASNAYGTFPYFLSKTAAEIPLLILQNLVMWLIAYWMMGLKGHFLVHWCASALVSGASTSIALLVGCIVADAKQAMEAAPGLFVPQILFAGFFVKMDMIPPFMRWIQYICSLKWGTNIAMINEFGDTPDGKKLIEMNDADPDLVPLYYCILALIFVGFRFAAMIVLSRKAKAFYN